jgi:hypothetical protein
MLTVNQAAQPTIVRESCRPMSMLRDLGLSIAALGISAGVLGVGLSCALTPAWAQGDSCAIQIEDLTGLGHLPGPAKARSGVLNDHGTPMHAGAEEDEEDCRRRGDQIMAVRL